MNISKLKSIIKNLPDDMIVCGSGHFGEELDIYDISLQSVGKGAYGDKGNFSALVIDMADKGPDPE